MRDMMYGLGRKKLRQERGKLEMMIGPNTHLFHLFINRILKIGNARLQGTLHSRHIYTKPRRRAHLLS